MADWPSAVRLRGEPEADGRHPVEIETGSHLGRILGQAPGPVNSLHHQGVAEPGAGLRAVARAPDSLIEAPESPDARFCVGVLWHPEKLAGPHRERLFAALIAACGEPSDSPSA